MAESRPAQIQFNSGLNHQGEDHNNSDLFQNQHGGDVREINVSSNSTSSYSALLTFERLGNRLPHKKGPGVEDPEFFQTYEQQIRPVRAQPLPAFAPANPQNGIIRAMGLPPQNPHPSSSTAEHVENRGNLSRYMSIQPNMGHYSKQDVLPQQHQEDTMSQQYLQNMSAMEQCAPYNPLASIFNARVNVQADFRPNQLSNFYDKPYGIHNDPQASFTSTYMDTSKVISFTTPADLKPPPAYVSDGYSDPQNDASASNDARTKTRSCRQRSTLVTDRGNELMKWDEAWWELRLR
jgi:hypothetical protein